MDWRCVVSDHYDGEDIVLNADNISSMTHDDFLTYEGNGITSDLVNAYEKNGKSQLSIMEVDGPDISKYGVVKLKNNIEKSIIFLCKIKVYSQFYFMLWKNSSNLK